MSALACTGEPVSWLRLERFAAGAKDAAIAEHVAACAACRACLDEITGDLVALPPLAVPASTPARRWIGWLAPALAVAAAAAIAIVVLRPEPETREDIAYVKGVGEVVLGVVRERGGVVRDDALTFAPGDRWKIVITCPPGASTRVEVGVTDEHSGRVDHPLAPATLTCGNRMVLPGAFTLTGDYPSRVCVRVSSVDDAASACLTITPE
ncbi:MAG: hypothetical protein JNL83_30215 [Myxococcales bacterium]|nr:hypothetical protein [Myxococcales bacterium]